MLATPGYWRRTAPGLESLDDADLIRGKILLAFERAEEIAALDRADTEKIRQLLTFVLVGAGTVGVEMASTLAEMSRMALARDFRHARTAAKRLQGRTRGVIQPRTRGGVRGLERSTRLSVGGPMDSATKHEIWVVALSTAVLEAPAVAIIALAFLAH